MIVDPEEEYSYLAQEIILKCPEPIRDLLSNCYLTIYYEDFRNCPKEYGFRPSLFGTLHIPDDLYSEVDKVYDHVSQVASTANVCLSRVSISDWMEVSRRKKWLEKFQVDRPKHYLELTRLLHL